MRIAQVVSVFPPYAGGIGNVAFEEAKKLAERGHEVVVFTPDYGQRLRLDVSNFEIQYLAPLFRYGNAALCPSIMNQLSGFDVVELHYPGFGLAEFVWWAKVLKRFSGKLILRYQMDVVGKGWLGKFFRWHTKYILPKILDAADKILVTSADYAEHSVIKDYYQHWWQRFTVLPLGVDLEMFCPRPKSEELLKKHALSQDDKILLMVCGLDKAHYFKGVDIALEAVKSIHDKNIKLLVVGDGELRFELENMAVNMGLVEEVRFIGRALRGELPLYYNLADLFLLPSIDKSEAFGLVVLEAMASGKPAVVSNLAGVRTLTNNQEFGFVAQVMNPVDLAEKIKTALNYGFDEREIRTWVEDNYSWNKVIDELERIFKE